MENEDLYSVKRFIAPAEERIKSYKQMQADLFKNKKDYEGNEEFFEWFREHLREMKNLEERGLKYLVHCRKYEKEGLNPPFCYPKTQENPYGYTNRKEDEL